MSNIDYLVIGSGPTAVATCAVLISRGIKPVVYDVGLNQKSSGLSPILNTKIESIKKWRGLDFTFWQVQQEDVVFDKSVTIRPSYGLGGFSRVWGATVFLDGRYRFKDKHLFLLNQIIPRENELEENSSLLSYFFKANETDRFTIIRPRHAVNYDTLTPRSCRKNMQCLSGCPEDAIWSSESVIKSLQSKSLIDYVPNKLVTTIQFDQIGDRVVVDGFDINKLESFTLTAKKVYLAAGPISSSIIMVRSKLFRELEIKDCHTDFSAVLNMGEVTSKGDKDKTLLSKVWIKDEMGQFFLQLYGSGKDFTERVFIRFPILNLKPFNKFILFLSNRTHPVIQYRNTRDSHSIRVFVDSCTGKIRVTKKSNYVRFFSSTLRNSSTLLKYFLSKQFLFLPLIASKVGAGYHLGSSLEFGKHLNIDGSIINLPHVFVVDASSLQDLSPGGLVYHSMLNAMEVTENSIGGS